MSFFFFLQKWRVWSIDCPGLLCVWSKEWLEHKTHHMTRFSRCIARAASACNARFMQNSELNAVQKIQTLSLYIYIWDIPVIIVFFCLLVSPVCVLACANMHHVKPPVFPVALSFCFPSVIPPSLVLSPPLYLSLCLSPPCCKKIVYTDTWGLHQTEGKTE